MTHREGSSQGARTDTRAEVQAERGDRLERIAVDTGEHPLHDLVQRNEQWVSPPPRLDSLTRWTRDTTIFLFSILFLLIVIVVAVKWL